jgi:RimJ/RimL family protein N-acetyltransferase
MPTAHPHTIQVDTQLVIRPYDASDAHDLYPRLLAHREDGLWWIGSIDQMRTIDDLLAEFNRVRALLDQGRRLGGAVVLDGRIVGTCRISGLSPAGTEGNLGYWLFPEARGRGVITRCAKTLLDSVFQRPAIERITIGACTTNDASIAVAKRLGFVFEKLNPGVLERAGRKWDAAIYSMPRARWLKN